MHLEQATRCLESRGPDFQDSWFDEKIGLGHRRLSIIDTSSAGHQPMTDASGRYRIVFNGEIYNYKKLQSELKSKGVVFTSDSDTEVLLYAYIHWGKNFLEKLNGFFAFAIYDQQQSTLFLARDRYGIKPLYYFQDEDKFIFASGMKSILSYGVERKIDREALDLYFQLTYIPAPLSILQGVKKLDPGCCLLVQKQNVEKSRYYEFPFMENPSAQNFGDASKSVIGILRSAVHDRLIADVPLGAFLSGGIDSSIIVALASEQVKGLKTFSIGFSDNKYFDETAYANLVADKFKTDHRVFSLSNDDLLQEVSHAVSFIDEPFADSSALPVYILSKKTKKHVTVALSGDGADEIFSGYNKHSAWLMGLNSGGIRNKLVNALGPAWKVLPKSRNNKVTDTFRKLERFAKAQNLDLKERYWFLASFTPKDQLNRLLKEEYKYGANYFKEEILKLISTGSLNEVLAADSQMVLQGDMLTKVDLMSMANGLEVRVPFLDPRVVSLAFSLPPCYKANGNSRKIILREAFKSYLPDALYYRPKHGFEVPLLDWFKNELKAELDRQVFNQEKITAQGIFEWKEITRIKSKLYSFNPGDIHVLVWSLYVFQNWYDRYFNSN